MSGLIWIQLNGIPEFFFKKVDFEKNQQMTKNHEKLTRGQRVNPYPANILFWKNCFHIASALIWVLTVAQVHVYLYPGWKGLNWPQACIDAK